LYVGELAWRETWWFYSRVGQAAVYGCGFCWNPAYAEVPGTEGLEVPVDCEIYELLVW